MIDIEPERKDARYQVNYWQFNHSRENARL